MIFRLILFTVITVLSFYVYFRLRYLRKSGYFDREEPTKKEPKNDGAAAS